MPAVPTRTGIRPYYSTSSVKLYVGDCLNILPQLPRQSAHLVFCDPPYNLGIKYADCDDKLTDAEYLDWSYKWLLSCKRVLKSNGSIYVAICARYQAEIKLIMDRLGYHWRSTIIWSYSFGPRQTTNWTPSWAAIHYYTLSPTDYIWNPLRVPSLRQLKYKDKRAVPEGKIPDNTWFLNPMEECKDALEGTNLLLESRICGTFKERCGHPCQMNIKVLERIIASSSRPGDIILDPMLGGGTTAAAALKLGRKAWGIELSQGYLDQYVIPRIQNYGI